MYATATSTAPNQSRPTLALRHAVQQAVPEQLQANTVQAQGDAGSVLASTDLLRGRKTVEISHNGNTYRLQATRLGKLILTK
jgi:hemin uptake protein HemP